MENKKKKLLRFNRFLSQKKMIALVLLVSDFFLLSLMNYIVNTMSNIKVILGNAARMSDYLGIEQFIINFSLIREHAFIRVLYSMALVALIILDAIIAYRIRISYSEEDINIGQKGTTKWATLDEIREQYVEIDLRDTEYDAPPGFPVCEYGGKIYIDTSPTNNLGIGITRSGKNEMAIFKSIDVYSRSVFKPSMIVTDMKAEDYKSSKKPLEERGYDVYFMNLAQPELSMGYNPLSIILETYKQGDYNHTQNLARSFAFMIFDPESQTGVERFFSEQAVALTTALVLAHIIDAVREDQEVNKKRKIAYEKKTALFKTLPEEEKENVRKEYENYAVDVFLNYDVQYIPDDVEYYDTNENEKKVNVYSIINTFGELSGRIIENTDKSALDLYFEKRPALDIAKMKYLSVKSAIGKTRASIYSTMTNKFDIFMSESMAKMTAESSLDLRDIGFGKKPIAIFIGLPDYDHSNYVMASLFIRQVYAVLAEGCWDRGKCARIVKIIGDEAGNLPKIDILPTMMSMGLGRGIYIDLYIQSFSQFEDTYGAKGYQTIMENCGNKMYIMAGSKKTANEFAELIGKETVVNVQRTGGRFELNKTYLESIDEKLLITGDQLMELRPGECVIKRIMKRTDNKGNAVTPKPIFNNIESGTRFKMRYEYMSDVFLNPTELSLNEINTESREHIVLADCVWDPNISFEQFARDAAYSTNNDKRMKSLPEDVQKAVYKVMKKILGDDISQEEVSDMDIDQIQKLIKADNFIKEYEKKAILITLRSAREKKG